MEFLRLLYEIPGAVTLAVMVAYALPFELDKKLNPLLMFLAALVCLFLPAQVTIALAMAVPMALVCGWTGVRLQGHTPVRLPTDEVRSLIAKARRRRPETDPILTREYPSPEEAEVVEAPVPKYVPEL
jgi:hypothetical protein